MQTITQLIAELDKIRLQYGDIQVGIICYGKPDYDVLPSIDTVDFAVVEHPLEDGVYIVEIY